MNKVQMRREIAARRRALDADWIDSASARIAERLQHLDAFRLANTVALYQAIAGEVNLDRLFPLCWKMKKRTCIPVFNAEQDYYEMAGITAETRFKTGNYGISEPETPALAPMESIDLVVVPGVAFDPAGNRLGRGGGYYDRLLDGFPGVSIAVAFDFQIFPQVPCDPHDQPVDGIVTESKIVKAHNER